jgi:cell wall-associated NlpC family hydrolase
MGYMQRAYRVLVCLVVVVNIMAAPASANKKGTDARMVTLSVALETRARIVSPSRNNDRIGGLLREAIKNKMGVPYRSGGTDQRGYDCSGLVWSVFQDAGLNFQRGSARTLWQQLPEASENEEGLFGTLVFFRDLRHVGIVADGNSFFHASSSKGVIKSNFSDPAGEGKNWRDVIVGFRRVKLAGPINR